ncbi:MAG: hypothetical protein HY017_11930 [Betaproteobacteria bacterium]|nr:hypothetical protein [Betaproteobacteria bacterium]
MKKLLLLALLSVCVDARAQASDGAGLPILLEGQADRVAELMSGAHAREFRTARRYHFVDVDGDGVPDPAVFFAIEGLGASNRHDLFFAVFRTEPLVPAGQRLRPSGYRLLDFTLVGSRGGRQIDFEKLSFANGVFTLQADAAGAKTPVLLRLGSDGRLAEVKP